MYPTLLSPLTIGPVTIKNRIAFAPTTMGLPDPERRQRLLEIAHGGCALIVLGDVAVEPTFHRSGFDLVTPLGIEACKALVQDLHEAGAKVAAQLFAPDYDTDGFKALLASPHTTREQLSDFMYGRVDRYVTDMTPVRIEELVMGFANRARAAQEAGFDMVQIHGDRLLGSFASSLYNQRVDKWGGTLDKRAQFACAVVRAVRATTNGRLAIDYKLAVRQPHLHLGKTGPTVTELPSFVQKLEAAGVDSLHIAGANHSSLEDTVPSSSHPILKGEGCFLNLVHAARPHTALPICAVGKLQTPSFVGSVLASGAAQWVGLSRQLLADPNWVAKVAQGAEDDIRRCVYCNRRCVEALKTHASFGCIFDPQDKDKRA